MILSPKSRTMLPPSFNFMVFVFAKKKLEVSYLGSEYQKATKTKTPKKKKKKKTPS